MSVLKERMGYIDPYKERKEMWLHEERKERKKRKEMWRHEEHKLLEMFEEKNKEANKNDIKRRTQNVVPR